MVGAWWAESARQIGTERIETVRCDWRRHVRLVKLNGAKPRGDQFAMVDDDYAHRYWTMQRYLGWNEKDARRVAALGPLAAC